MGCQRRHSEGNLLPESEYENGHFGAELVQAHANQIFPDQLPWDGVLCSWII